MYRRLLLEALEPPYATLLELGSGGGNNASHLKKHFALTLVDLSDEMLHVSQRLNPQCEHVRGDMREVRLDRTFDCILVHDAISYMATEADLVAAISTAYIHCRPGGAALFAPNYIVETFTPSTDHGGSDDTLRSVRYLEWTWDPDPSDTTYTIDYAFILRDLNGMVQVEADHHVEGLFSRADWLRILTDAGFDATALMFEHSKVPFGSTEVFVAHR